MKYYVKKTCQFRKTWHRGLSIQNIDIIFLFKVLEAYLKYITFFVIKIALTFEPILPFLGPLRFRNYKNINIIYFWENTETLTIWE